MRVQYVVRHVVKLEVYMPSGIRPLENLFEFLIVQQSSMDVESMCSGVIFCQLNSLNAPDTFPTPPFLFVHTWYTKYVEKYVEQQSTKWISSTRE